MKQTILAAALAASLGVLAGCQSAPTALEADFGNSVRQVNALSRVNPAAPANPAAPVEGGDPDMLNAGIENLRKGSAEAENTVRDNIVIDMGGRQGQ